MASALRNLSSALVTALLALWISQGTPGGQVETAAAGSGAETPAIPQALDVDRLERELARTDDPDSVRFCLAIAWREVGGVEGRQRSLQLFEKIRRRYFHDPRYHLEFGRTYLEAGRRSDASDQFDRAIRLEPQEPGAYLAIIRLLREQILRYGHPDDIAEALVRTARAIDLHPSHVELREERTRCLLLAGLYLPGERTRRAAQVLQTADSLLALAPESASASLLRAVALVDLGRAREAEAVFRRCDGFLQHSPVPAEMPGTPPAMVDPVPGPAGSTEPAAADLEAAWNRLDPTPLTPANEARLEYWRRLALADLLYADAPRGLRGWQTARGDVYLRYGPPQDLQFRHAFWDEGEAQFQIDLALARRRAHLLGSLGFPFLHPVQRWSYRDGDREMVFEFVDAGFSGRFVPLDGVRHQAQIRELPAVLPGTQAGRSPDFFFAASGTRGVDGRTRVGVLLAVPVSGDEEIWGLESHHELRIFDAAGREVATELTETSRDSIREPAAGLRLLTARSGFLLPPGNYTTEVRLESRSGGGTVAFPLTVRSFGSERLEISDVELSFAPASREAERDTGRVAAFAGPPWPNPGGLFLPGARTLVRYEVYNFAPDANGTVRYRSRYALVPREYALSVARLIESGDSSVDPSFYLGASGRSLGGITLHTRNYVDVTFPEVTASLEPGARGRFTFEADASRLEPGEYALVILVRDEVARASALTQALIRRIEP